MTLPCRGAFKRQKRKSDEHDEKSSSHQTSQPQPASIITPELFLSAITNHSLPKLMASSDQFLESAQQCYQTALAIKASYKARAWAATHHCHASGGLTALGKLGQTVRYIRWVHNPNPDRDDAFSCTFVIGYAGARVAFDAVSEPHHFRMTSTSLIPPWLLWSGRRHWIKLALYFGLPHTSADVLAQLLQRFTDPYLEVPEGETWDSDWGPIQHEAPEAEKLIQQQLLQEIQRCQEQPQQQQQQHMEVMPYPVSTSTSGPGPSGSSVHVNMNVNGSIQLSVEELDRLYDW